ncbi:hypothetical protein D3C75_628630 [compost metagenome]
MQAENSSCSFAKAQPKLEQRFQPQPFQHQLMALLAGDMGGNHIMDGLRSKRLGSECRCAGDEAVQNDGNPSRCRSENQTGKPGNFQSSYFGQYIDGVLSIRGIELQRPIHNGDFMTQPLIVNPGAPAYCRFSRNAFQRAEHCSTGRGIADAHFAGNKNLRPALHRFLCHAHPYQNSPFRFLAAHRRPLRHIGAAVTHFTVNQLRMAQVSAHADIHQLHLSTRLTGQYINPCAAAEEIVGHLHCDLLRKSADPFAADAVVRSHNHHRALAVSRLLRLRDAGQPDGQRLKPAETARRLSQYIQPLLRTPDRFLIGRGNPSDYCFNC